MKCEVVTMHRTVTNTILSILLIALIIIVLPANAFAASASASVSSSTVKPGDTVTVTITFKDNNIGGVYGTYSYDSNILQYISDTWNSEGKGKITLYAGPGTSSISGKITFKALKAGTAKVEFESEEILSYDLKPLSNAKTCVNITVKAPSSGGSSSSNPNNSSSGNTSNNKPESNTEEKEEPQKNPVDEAIKVTLENEQLYLWKDLSSVKLPDGFKSGEAFYKTVKIQAAIGKNQNITLAYLTDEKGENGSFYILDNDKLYPYITLNTTSTYTILQLDDPAKLPEGYKETELKLGNQTVQAWQLESGEHPDFYLLYAMNDKGKKGFYLYDQAEKTMQRYTNRTVVKEPEPMTLIEKLTSDTKLLAVVGTLGALSLILLIILIVLYIRIRQYFGKARTYYPDIPDGRYF